MKLPCGCCKGISVVTPVSEENPVGQDKLRYRAGTHSSFLASMTARLSAAAYPELAGLTTRDPSDPSLAMLDAWATIADVLTFYQERIANEGFLRTATERLSILELSRLVGYTLKPGVASSLYLAYKLENGYTTEIPLGQRAQSLPAPGELPQSFETSEVLGARSGWNAIRPRMTRPQNILLRADGTLSQDRIFLKGTANNVKANDLLLFVFENSSVLRLTREINIQAAENRTEVHLAMPPEIPGMESPQTMTGIFTQLALTPSIQPAGSRLLKRSMSDAIAVKSDVVPQMIMNMDVVPGLSLYAAWANADFSRTSPQLKGIYVFRLKASLFGYNALPPVKVAGIPAGPG